MDAAESRRGFFRHIPFENRGIGAAEVYDDESVEDVGELAVQIETEQLATDFCVLAQQNGQTLAVGFDVGDGLREFIEITESAAHGLAIPRAQKGWTKFAARHDQSREIVFLHA